MRVGLTPRSGRRAKGEAGRCCRGVKGCKAEHKLLGLPMSSISEAAGHDSDKDKEKKKKTNKVSSPPHQLFSSLLPLLAHQPVVVELNNDVVYRGTLSAAPTQCPSSSSSSVDLHLEQCRCEDVSTGRRWEEARQVCVRDRAVRSVILPPDFDPIRALGEVRAHERRNQEVASRRRKLMTRKELKARQQQQQQQQRR